MRRWRNRDYSRIDLAEINSVLFYPRQEFMTIEGEESIREISIPLKTGETIGGIWAEADKAGSSILFFHGNGEIASDYIDIAAIFQKMNINFICVDYRGYGKSTGHPRAGSMIDDAHDIFKYTRNLISKDNELFIVMGRSLGCVSALEIAASYENEIDGLILESSFAQTLPLLAKLGVNAGYLGINEEDGFDNGGKIESFSKPLLIIHATEDFLIPINQAQILFKIATSHYKTFLKVPNAGHNDIFFQGMKEYLASIIKLIKTAAELRSAAV
jgi:pimeloyl-ACP methyl ester carboxylesterase